MQTKTALAVAGLCGVLAGAAAHAQERTIKVGIVESLSGPQAASGQSIRTAVRYGIDRINAEGGWHGTKLELIEYDNQGTAAGAADKLRSAIAEGVRIVLHGASSAIGGQITEDVRKHNLRNPGKEVIYLSLGALALDLTGEKCHFHHFRLGPNSNVDIKALVGAMAQAKALGPRVYVINQNYSAGVDMEAAFVSEVRAAGATVVEKALHDVNKIQDFAPWVAKIKAANVDTVLTGNWSNDLLFLMKAAKASGLKARFGTLFLDQPGNIANAGESAEGHFVAHSFNVEANAAAEALGNDYKAKTGHYPVYLEPTAMFGVAFLGEALKKVPADAKELNVNALGKALEQTRLSTPVGEWSMRAADHQGLIPLVVSTVSPDARFKVDGSALGFRPVKIIPAQDAATAVQANCRINRPD
ncbi:MAG: ABC transporter substrate-binding protein [Burkholderiaceae bacterium]